MSRDTPASPEVSAGSNSEKLILLALVSAAVNAAAAAQGLNDQRYKKFVEHLPLSRYTLQRWLTWWQEKLPETPSWRQLQGRVPSIS